MQPTVGRIVHYQLSAHDVTLINQQVPVQGLPGSR